MTRLGCLAARDGLQIEKFRVGAVNQVAILNKANAHPLFKVTNIAGNGKILCRDGSIRDLYAERHNAKRLNENGMSLGPGHVVLTVAPGGAKYNIAYVTADDESMKVTGAYDFESSLL